MKRKKVRPNLFLKGDVYYYRKGSVEISLDTKVEAEAFAAQDIIEAKSKAFGVNALRLTAGDLFPKYLRYCEIDGGYRARSLKEIQDIVRLYLNPHFKKMKLADITESAWIKYTKKKEVRDYANHRKVMNLFLKWCRENDYYYGRPQFSIPDHKRRRRRILTPDQIKLLFQHADGGFLLFSVLTLMHHFRSGEAIKAEVALIDLDRAFIKLRDEAVKTGQGRPVPLNSFAIELIKKRLSERKVKSKWLFENARDPKRHMSDSGFKTAWHTVQRRAEGALDGVTWHDFRATGEKYSHKSKDFTDTQREKFSGASIDVQKRIYVSMDADDLRGLENAVQVDGLDDILKRKVSR